MPLFEKVRIEIYLPDLPYKPAYQRLLNELNQELAIGFGGCSVIRIDGSYRSQTGVIIADRVNLLYTDISYSLEQHFEMVSRYTDSLREAASTALNEEAIIVAVYKIYWSE